MTNPALPPSAPKSTAARLLAVLLVFEHGGGELTLSEIARKANLSVSSTKRLLGQLCDVNFLDRVESGGYQVGSRLFEIGMMAPVPRMLREVALPIMQDLYTATRENVHLGVLDSHGVLVIQRHTGDRSVPTPVRSGARMPAHATSNGKTLLAFSEPELVQRVLARGLPSVTTHTISSEDQLNRQLDEIRKRGWAMSQEENSLGTLSVGAPVFGDDGYAIAALSLVIPVTTGEVRPYAHAVKTAATTITRLWAQTHPLS